MYVSFCGHCKLPLPLSEYDGSNCCCRRCVEANDRNKAKAGGGRDGVFKQDGGEGRFLDDPLLLKDESVCGAF